MSARVLKEAVRNVLNLRLLRRDPPKYRRRVSRSLVPGRAAPEYRRRWRMTLSDWLRYHQNEVVFEQCRWMGIEAQKNPCDAWIYQEIVHEVQPDVIVELGSAVGGTTLYLAHLLDLLGRGTVVSVDIDRSRFAAEHPRIVTVTGDSSSPETLAQVEEVCRDRAVLVIHDADHSKEAVLRDLRAYSPLVSIGSYLIVEDGIMDLFRPGDVLGTWDEGPLSAVEEFVRENSEFEIDHARERYLLTYNPRGFLRRIR